RDDVETGTEDDVGAGDDADVAKVELTQHVAPMLRSGADDQTGGIPKRRASRVKNESGARRTRRTTEGPTAALRTSPSSISVRGFPSPRTIPRPPPRTAISTS